MTPTWQRVRDVRAFLNEPAARSVGVHAFTKRVCSWPYCARCGLVALKNDASRRAAAGACVVIK